MEIRIRTKAIKELFKVYLQTATNEVIHYNYLDFEYWKNVQTASIEIAKQIDSKKQILQITNKFQAMLVLNILDTLENHNVNDLLEYRNSVKLMC